MPDAAILAGMSADLSDRRLARHLATAILVKLAVLAALWWWFVRDATVAVDADRAAAQLTSAARQPSISRGAPQ